MLKAKSKAALPPRRVPMFGRSRESQQILALMSAQTQGSRLLIHGVPGVGKSAFMLEIGHELATAQTYDFVVWIDCQRIDFEGDRIGASPTALNSLSEIVRELALILGAKSALSGSERKRIQAIRAHLAEVSCLVLVDSVDAVEDAGVHPFLKSLPDSVDVVASSRERLDWRDHFELLPFQSDDVQYRSFAVHELKRRGLQHSHEVVEKLTDLSEGLPRTLVWLIDLLESGCSVDELEDELKDSDGSLYEYYFRKQTVALAENKHLLRAVVLVVMAQPVSTVHASKVLDRITEAKRPKSLLMELKRLHLVFMNNNVLTTSRLTSGFVLKRFGSDRDELIQVVSGWASTICDLIDHARVHTDWNDLFNKIDTFRLELFAALNWIGRLRDPNLSAIALRMLNTVAYYEYCRGFWSELIDVAKWALPEALESGELRFVLDSGLTWVLRAYRYRDGASASSRFFDETLNVVQTGYRNSPYLDVYLKVVSAGIHLNDSDRAKAIELEACATALARAEKMEWACRAKLQSGNIYSKLSELKIAEDAFRWVGRVASSYKGEPWAKEMLALSKGSLGILANRDGRWDQAIEHLETSVPGLAQNYDQAVVIGELALSYYHLRNYRAATMHYNVCARLKNQMGLDRSIVESVAGWDTNGTVRELLANNNQRTLGRVFGFIRRWLIARK